MDLAEALKAWGMGPELVTFFVSMVPIIELRGAVPIGVYLGLPLWKAAVISVFGNMIPVPFIIAFVRIVFAWIQAHIRRLAGFVSRMETKAERHRDAILKGVFWGLLAFVAIPLPGTGAWTGAMIAALLNIRMKRALPAIFAGVLIACVIVSMATMGVISII